MNKPASEFIGRLFGLFIALTLAVPCPSFALRQTGLEEQRDEKGKPAGYNAELVAALTAPDLAPPDAVPAVPARVGNWQDAPALATAGMEEKPGLLPDSLVGTGSMGKIAEGHGLAARLPAPSVSGDVEKVEGILDEAYAPIPRPRPIVENPEVLDLLEKRIKAGLEEVLEDYGEVKSWEEAFAKVRELFSAKQIQAIGTVSLAEVQRGSYAMMPLDVPELGGGLQSGGKVVPPTTVLQWLSEMAPNLYPGNERYRLLRTRSKFSTGQGKPVEVTSLVVVYLKPGETYKPGAGLEEGGRRIAEDYGSLRDWEDVRSAGIQLYRAGSIQYVAAASFHEFLNRQYYPVQITSDDVLRKLGDPSLSSAGEVTYRLLREVRLNEQGSETSTLVIVYQRRGEEADIPLQSHIRARMPFLPLDDAGQVLRTFKPLSITLYGRGYRNVGRYKPGVFQGMDSETNIEALLEAIRESSSSDPGLLRLEVALLDRSDPGANIPPPRITQPGDLHARVEILSSALTSREIVPLASAGIAFRERCAQQKEVARTLGDTIWTQFFVGDFGLDSEVQWNTLSERELDNPRFSEQIDQELERVARLGDGAKILLLTTRQGGIFVEPVTAAKYEIKLTTLPRPAESTEESWVGRVVEVVDRYMAQPDISGVVPLLQDGNRPLEVTGSFSGLRDSLQGQGITVDRVYQVPPAYFQSAAQPSQAIRVHLDDPQGAWAGAVGSQLESAVDAQGQPLIQVVESAQDARVVVSERDFQIDPTKQSLLRVQPGDPERVKRLITKALFGPDLSGLLVPGTVVYLYQGDPDKDVYLFA